MNGADTLDCDRLAKLCGMFGSDHAGEWANAAAAADKLVRAAGLRWPDVVLPALAPPDPDPPSWITGPFWIANYCLDFRDTILTAWETEFCRNVGIRAANGGRVSPKQRAILCELFGKCRRNNAGGRA